MLNKDIILIIAIIVVICLIVKVSCKNNKKINNEGFTSHHSSMEEVHKTSSEPEIIAPSMKKVSFDEKKHMENIYKQETSENPLSGFFDTTMKAEDDENYEGVNYKFSDKSYAPVNGAFTLGVDLKNDPAFKEVAEMTSSNSQQLVAADLLPKKDKDWFETPSVGVTIDEANLLDGIEYRSGVNTTHSTLRNANLDIRGNVPVPKITVGPFNNSSYDFDNNIQSWCE